MPCHDVGYLCHLGVCQARAFNDNINTAVVAEQGNRIAESPFLDQVSILISRSLVSIRAIMVLNASTLTSSAAFGLSIISWRVAVHAAGYFLSSFACAKNSFASIEAPKYLPRKAASHAHLRPVTRYYQHTQPHPLPLSSSFDAVMSPFLWLYCG